MYGKDEIQTLRKDCEEFYYGCHMEKHMEQEHDMRLIEKY